jgi:hypothetical protein
VLHIDVYWGPRREDARQCAARATSFLEGLGRIDASLAAWGWTDYENSAEFHRLPLTLEALQKRLVLGRHQNDDGELIERLGYSIELSDRFDVDRIRITIDCGGFAPLTPNSVRFEIGSWGDRTSVRSFVAILDHTMSAWDGDAGAVTVRGLGELFPYVQGSMYMGSCLRLPVSPSELPALPAGVRIESRGTRSSLVVLTEERFDLDDPAHVDVARRTHAALDRAGLLKVS